MTRLIDETIGVLTELHYWIADLDFFDTQTLLPLLKRWEEIHEQEIEEAKLTEEDLSNENEASDYTALDPEYEEQAIDKEDWPQIFHLSGLRKE